MQNENEYMCDGGGCWRPALAIVAAAMLAGIIFGGCGCAHGDIDRLRGKWEAVAAALEDLKDAGNDAAEIGNGEKPADTPADTPAQSAAAGDEVEFARFQWKFGGFNGAGAQRDMSVELANLKNNGRVVSYTWVKGLSAWGFGHTDAGAICAIFVQQADGSWVGGKFDWISTSRASRELKHLENYNGWNMTLPINAPVAFVVVSADGRRRSNVIVAGDVK